MSLTRIVDHPLLVFAVSIIALWLSAYVGDFIAKRVLPLRKGERDYFGVILTASLTLLALIIGFSFAMAISRYDQRKNDEEAEANAIGTEYVRADLLPAADASRVRELLRKYLDQRMLFYETRDAHRLGEIEAGTAQLQNELWSTVQRVAAAQPTPVVALALSGMNDVLNSEGYTQAAWWNRIPIAAWALMAAIAVSCSLLLGYDAPETDALLFLVLPIVVAIPLFLIADIDSPRGGVIRVLPHNLERLAHSLHAH